MLSRRDVSRWRRRAIALSSHKHRDVRIQARRLVLALSALDEALVSARSLRVVERRERERDLGLVALPGMENAR